MRLCIYRIEQKEHHGVRHFCRQDRIRCGGMLQVACTAQDYWPAWLVVAFGAAAVVFLVTV